MRFLFLFTSVETGDPRQYHFVVRVVERPEIGRWVGMRENGQRIDRTRGPETVLGRAPIVTVIVLVHLYYGQRRFVIRFIHL